MSSSHVWSGIVPEKLDEEADTVKVLLLVAYVVFPLVFSAKQFQEYAPLLMLDTLNCAVATFPETVDSVCAQDPEVSVKSFTEAMSYVSSETVQLKITVDMLVVLESSGEFNVTVVVASTVGSKIVSISNISTPLLIKFVKEFKLI